jgi:ech hydrogenase subunit E
MKKSTVIPLGPQHPVLPEPLSFDLVIENEKVVQAVPSIGFVHRGLELLAPKRDFEEFVLVAERICGICSFIHGMGYCHGAEQLTGTQVPRRAQQLRIILSEVSRVHSHLLWLGLAADAFGFENLFMQTWRIRERVLDLLEETTGGRVIFCINKVGGLRKDIDADTLHRMVSALKGMEAEIKEITDVFLNDSGVQHRLTGLAVLTEREAADICVVGPMARASGLKQDLRMADYLPYKELDWEIITAKGGDCMARCEVRINEIFQSIRIIEQQAAKMDNDGVCGKITAPPKGEVFVRMEQPRGEVVYYLRGNGTRFLERFRVRTPTFTNVPAVVKLVQGVELADVASIILTIDPCISCMER